MGNFEGDFVVAVVYIAKVHKATLQSTLVDSVPAAPTSIRFQ